MRRLLAVALLLAMVMTASACSSTKFIEMRTQVPPELDIPLHIKNLAVLEFSGHQTGGEVVAVKLQQELLNNQHYKIIERSQIANIINEKNFQRTDLVENNEFLEQMKILQVQAIITGSVANFNAQTSRGTDYKTERYIRTYRRIGTDKNGNPITTPVWDTRQIPVPWIKVDGNVNATFKMIDVGTGQVISTVSEAGSSSTGKVTGNAAMPTESELLNRATLDSVIKFIKKISPWIERSRIPLKNGKNCAVGINFAINGLYDKAEEQFRMAAQTVPGNYAAVYNLGLALEAQYRYEEAMEAYDNALSMAPSDKDIMNAINRIKKKQHDLERLRRLKEGQ